MDSDHEDVTVWSRGIKGSFLVGVGRLQEEKKAEDEEARGRVSVEGSLGNSTSSHH